MCEPLIGMHDGCKKLWWLCRYNLTKWAIQLNEVTRGLKEKLAPTDCRLRPDQHHLELGDYDQASHRPSACVLCTASSLLLWLGMRCGAWVRSLLSCKCQMRPPQHDQALDAPGVRVSAAGANIVPAPPLGLAS